MKLLIVCCNSVYYTHSTVSDKSAFTSLPGSSCFTNTPAKLSPSGAYKYFGKEEVWDICVGSQTSRQKVKSLQYTNKDP